MQIDRIYGWKSTPDNPVRASLADQDEATLTLFRDRAKQVRLELMQHGWNAELYFENSSLSDTISMVPTSAHTGEGIQDLLLMVMQMSQDLLTKRIMYVCCCCQVQIEQRHSHAWANFDHLLATGTCPCCSARCWRSKSSKVWEPRSMSCW